jgi:hypothetical protein
MLPFEDENRQEIARLFPDEFDLAARMLAASTTVLEAIGCCKTSHRKAQHVIWSLVTREIRRYRTIVATLELGYLENAEILTRSLYEALLCQRFIMMAPVDSSRLPKAWHDECDRRGPDFRAWLYACYPLVQRKKQLDKISKSPGVSNPIEPAQRQMLDKMIDEAQLIIGEDWLNRLRKNSTCAGVSIEELSGYCGLTAFHQKAYRLFCHKSHGGDAFEHVFLSGDTWVAKVGPDIRNWRLVFGMATVLFAQLLKDADEAFGLGASHLLDPLVQRLAQVERKA